MINNSRKQQNFTSKFTIQIILVFFLLLQTSAIAKVDPGSDADTELAKKMGCDKVKSLALGSASNEGMWVKHFRMKIFDRLCWPAAQSPV